MVAGPLRRTDCSPISDGAAALVLTRAGAAPAEAPAVAVRAIAQRNDYLPLSRRDPSCSRPDAGPGRARWPPPEPPCGTSTCSRPDCFTIAELIEYEMLGLCAPARGGSWSRRAGRTGTRLPVNPSGGLKSKGHPIGATGVSQHVLAAMQLTGAAGAMQVPGATRAGVFNMGGTAVANYASILERLR